MQFTDDHGNGRRPDRHQHTSRWSHWEWDACAGPAEQAARLRRLLQHEA